MLVVIGAGPYGIATAARAIERGIETVVLGRSFGFWTDNMPEGMYLRSGPDWHLDATGVHTFESFLESIGTSIRARSIPYRSPSSSTTPAGFSERRVSSLTSGGSLPFGWTATEWRARRRPAAVFGFALRTGPSSWLTRSWPLPEDAVFPKSA